MAYEHILYDVLDGIGKITLNRPDTYNSLSLATIQEIIAAFKACSRDKSMRTVILTGEGKGFSSGADLMELGGDLANIDITETLRAGLNVIVSQMRSLDKPIVCAVNGVAAGAGASLALAADYRLASGNASFVFAAFVNIGLVPDAGNTYLLQKFVGPAKALELALFADSKHRVDAQNALEFGIVNRIVPHDQLVTETDMIAKKLASMPTKAIAMTKRAIYRASEHAFLDAIDYEAQLQGAAFQTFDFKEGVSAFIERREPVFRGE